MELASRTIDFPWLFRIDRADVASGRMLEVAVSQMHPSNFRHEISPSHKIFTATVINFHAKLIPVF